MCSIIIKVFLFFPDAAVIGVIILSARKYSKLWHHLNQDITLKKCINFLVIFFSFFSFNSVKLSKPV